jgi:hypothetical protein
VHAAPSGASGENFHHKWIDHGSCATRIPWVDRGYGDPNTKGLLNQLQMQFNNTLYDQTARSLFDAGVDLSGFEWQVNRIEPSFTHFAWDGLTGIHSDGFAFQNHLHMNNGSQEVWVVADAHYTMGLEQGVPHIYPLTTHGSMDKSGFTWTIVGLVFDWLFSGFQNATVNDYINNTLMAHGLPLCDAGAIDCTLQHDFPASFADTVRAQMTTIIGDPMAYSTCSVTSDCPGGKGFVCNSGRCLVPITPGMPGYLTSSPSTNFRTELDWLDNASGHLDSVSCTPITPGQTMTIDNGLAGCQALLSKLLQSKGLSATTADNLAYQSRGGVHDYQYGCVTPQRPQCGGDGSFSSSTGYSGGYFCRNSDVSPGSAGTGVIASRCTWRPAFRRLNVLPTSLELVWSEAGVAASADERIVKLLAPAQACSDPATVEIDVSESTAFPRLVHEGPL